MIAIPMKVSVNVGIPVKVSDKPIIPAEVGAKVQIIGGEPYTGSYSFTPSGQQQTALTQDKVLYQNIVIGAIPYTETDNSAGGKTLAIG